MHSPNPNQTWIHPDIETHHAQILWLKSRSSEVWLERRTNYTRSTGVMSMVRHMIQALLTAQRLARPCTNA